MIKLIFFLTFLLIISITVPFYFYYPFDLEEASISSKSKLAKAYFVNASSLKDDAKCLDGTPPVYFHLQGHSTGFRKWLIFFEGGGWCTFREECISRSQSYFGSSKDFPPYIHLDSEFYHYFSKEEGLNPLMHNWNKVYIHYCDGGSFSGNAVSKYKIENEEKVIYYKGKNILKAIFDDLMQNRGLTGAIDIVLSGGSAGGLSVFLHLDYLVSILTPYNEGAKIVGLPISGYFPDKEGPFYFSSRIKWIFDNMNVMESMNHECLRHHNEKEYKCLFAPNILPFIQAPIFVIQSQYDSWQQSFIYALKSSLGFKNYGQRLMRKLLFTLNEDKNKKGGWIDSCSHHLFMFNEIKIDGLAQSEAFYSWYTGKGEKIYLQNENYPCHWCCNNY